MGLHPPASQGALDQIHRPESKIQQPGHAISGTKRKRDFVPDPRDLRPVKRPELTFANLQQLETTSSSTLPPADTMAERVAALQGQSNPLRRNRSQDSLQTMEDLTGSAPGSTTGGKLRTNPFGFAVRMFERFGVIHYMFGPPADPTSVQDAGLVTPHQPKNLSEIQQALNQERDDLPGRRIFQQYSDRAIETAEHPAETEVEKLFHFFLNPHSRDEGYHGHLNVSWENLNELLPAQQFKIRPDMTAGINPTKLGRHVWIAEHIQGHVTNRALVCVNGVAEFKSSVGSIAKARVQNRAAAHIACRTWLNDEITLTAGRGESEVIGNAFVGSIAFDGSSIEASIHWLDKSITSSKRPYDVFSLRVATGHPFAVNLTEFQDCYRKFANFLDWLLAVRVKRLAQIRALPDHEPDDDEWKGVENDIGVELHLNEDEDDGDGQVEREEDDEELTPETELELLDEQARQSSASSRGRERIMTEVQIEQTTTKSKKQKTTAITS
ncbi:MAG: hypothetical protein M1823_004196 [Watsoniomyces obsoletus]|nr:MAG: hypothetical protein M1823_004196 [Watsoniomyces obsoletus]